MGRWTDRAVHPWTRRINPVLDSVAEAGTGYRGVAADLRAGVMTNNAFAS